MNTSCDNLIIRADCTIKDALKKIDENPIKILYVIENERLIGTLTDGDIRRHLLRTGTIGDIVLNACNTDFIYLKQKNAKNADRIMHEKCISSVPVVDSQFHIVRIYVEGGEIVCYDSVKLPVVIQAGGLGTRLYPYTKILPKPLIPIGDIPVVEHIINRFVACGCDNFYMIVNHKKNMIKAYFNEIDKDYKLHFIDENIPLGTGGGLSLLKGIIGETFILTNCDILLDGDISDIIDYHIKSANVITMICANKKIQIPYGVVNLDRNGKISEMIEKPTIEYLTNTGMYIVDGCVINDVEPNTNIGFPDIFDKYRTSNRNVGVFTVDDAAWSDMGELQELDKMNKKLYGE